MSDQRLLVLCLLTSGLIGGVSVGADPVNRWSATQNSSQEALKDGAFTRVGELRQRIDQLESENRLLRRSTGSPTISSSIQVANAELIPMADSPPDSIAFPPSHFESETITSEMSCTATEQEPGEGDWKTHWNHGIEWISPDEAFKVHIGGRVQLDSVFMHEHGNSLIDASDPAGPKDLDAVTFRRARLQASGTMYERIDYLVEFDFVNSVNRNDSLAPNNESNTINVPAPTDVWLTFREVLGGANLRVGNMKEPFGFEHSASSRFLNFMERSPLQDLYAGPFNNGFSPGIMAYNTWDEESGTWWLGAFKNNNFNVFGYNVGDGEYAATGRATYTPLYCEDCQKVFHIGLAGSVRDPDQDQSRYRARSLRNGPANLSTVFADTNRFHSETQWLAGIELAAVSGPWSFAAEWMGSWDNDASTLGGAQLGTVFTNGYYLEALYFLTGESREYNRKTAAFDRVIPHQNFRWKNCCSERGAWQIGARYAAADLRDGALNGGLLQELTLGVNWFLNPNMKVQWNYALTERDTPQVTDGYSHGFGARLAYDF